MDTSEMLQFYRDHMEAMEAEHESEKSDEFIDSLKESYKEWSETELFHHAIDIFCMCYERNVGKAMMLLDEMRNRFENAILETVAEGIIAKIRKNRHSRD